MTKLHFSITIKAPKEKVWNMMLGEETYRKWTEVFAPGSHYIGNWTQGSRILFLAPGENGESGMVSRINQNRPYEFISIEHLGVVQNGTQDTSSDAVMNWSGAREEYRFREVDGGTEVLVDTDTPDEFRKMFTSVWPKALQRLKELAEKNERAVTRKRVKAGTIIPQRRGKR